MKSHRVDHLLKPGVVHSLKPPETDERKPAVFFDRDGVLNVDRGYVAAKDDFEWIPGAPEAIEFLNESGWWVFVVTNQSGIGRGYYTELEFLALTEWMNARLALWNAHIDATYYCPHHPDAEVAAYHGDCSCRKPAPGMLHQALADFPVDASRSFLIGDKQTDVEAAEAVGIPGHLFPGGNLYEYLRRLIL